MVTVWPVLIPHFSVIRRGWKLSCKVERVEDVFVVVEHLVRCEGFLDCNFNTFCWTSARSDCNDGSVRCWTSSMSNWIFCKRSVKCEILSSESLEACECSDADALCQHEDIRQCVQAGNNIFVLMHTWYRYVEMRISDSMYKQETIYLSWCTYDACVESLRRLSMIRVLIHNIWGMILYVDAT